MSADGMIVLAGSLVFVILAALLLVRAYKDQHPRK
jgi:hypothetical protein